MPVTVIRCKQSQSQWIQAHRQDDRQGKDSHPPVCACVHCDYHLPTRPNHFPSEAKKTAHKTRAGQTNLTQALLIVDNLYQAIIYFCPSFRIKRLMWHSILYAQLWQLVQLFLSPTLKNFLNDQFFWRAPRSNYSSSFPNAQNSQVVCSCSFAATCLPENKRSMLALTEK